MALKNRPMQILREVVCLCTSIQVILDFEPVFKEKFKQFYQNFLRVRK